MLKQSVFYVFIPTFFVVSATPGLCMTLAMTMGMSIGIRRTIWMMLGELLGVGLVAALSVIGVAAVLLDYPRVFSAFKILGGAYLVYVGVMMCLSKGKMALPETVNEGYRISRKHLAMQGFITAIANPKAWAFFVALLPPFIDRQASLLPQLSLLIVIILVIEAGCLFAYTTGGRSLMKLLNNTGNVKRMNRFTGGLMMLVGIWLAVS